MGEHDTKAETGSTTNNKSRHNDGLHRRRGIWHFKMKVGGGWKEFLTHTTNYNAARKVRQRSLQEYDAGNMPTDMAKWTIGKAGTVWKESRGREAEAGTISGRTYISESYLSKALVNSLSGKRLGEITLEDIEAYRSLRVTKVNPRTVNLEIKILRMILRRARLWARLADGYRPLPENKRGPGRALAPQQEERLFETAATNPQWETAYNAAILAAHTSCRSKELRGLRLDDLDLMERTITIRRATTKTDAGCRIIPLDSAATRAAARLLERARMLGSTEPSHYLFPFCRFRQTKRGLPSATTGYDVNRPMEGWRSAWESLREAAGLPGLRFHDLRHHCITRLAESGVLTM
jgi:integrase